MAVFMRRRSNLHSSRLPPGYTELSYIQSTGTQWIDTGHKPNQDSVVEIGFQVTLNDEETYAICGSRNGASGANEAFGLFKMNSTRFDSYIAGQIKNISAAAINPHTAILTGKSITFDGAYNSFNGSNFSGNYNFLVCAMNQQSGVDNRIASMKVFYCRGIMVTSFDLVPCRDPNGRIGMFDLSTNSFHNNAGSGEFIAGPNV